MEGFRTDWLSILATKVTGKPCTVKIEPLGREAWGVAYFDGKSYIVALHAVLFATRDARAVAETFWHECAHVKLGHCGRKTERTEETTRAAAAWAATPAGKSQEEAADEWAAGCMRQVPYADLWTLSLAR